MAGVDPGARTPSLREIEQELRRFIVVELLEEPFEGDPLALGAVDSLGLEQIVKHVERRFGVAIADREMTRDNFAAIPALAALVVAKRTGERR